MNHASRITHHASLPATRRSNGAAFRTRCMQRTCTCISYRCTYVPVLVHQGRQKLERPPPRIKPLHSHLHRRASRRNAIMTRRLTVDLWTSYWGTAGDDACIACPLACEPPATAVPRPGDLQYEHSSCNMSRPLGGRQHESARRCIFVDSQSHRRRQPSPSMIRPSRLPNFSPPIDRRRYSAPKRPLRALRHQTAS